jgi:hypothetical protein
MDESEKASLFEIKDYASLDKHPDLMLYKGCFDERSKQVKLEEKEEVNWDTTIFTQAEIQQKIEALREPGDLFFFYIARGTIYGGPLGMGAAVIELNPNHPARSRRNTAYTQLT